MFSNINRKAIIHLDAEVKLFFLYVFLIVYMLYGTGIVSDDFAFLVTEHNNKSILESISNGNLYLERPLLKFVYSIFYYFIDLNQLALIYFLKIFQTVLIFYMTTKFFSIFLDVTSSMLVSFLFIFFPTHDSTTYFYLGMYLSLSIALYLYAYYLVCSNRLISGGIFSTLASFLSYGSPPVAFSLFILCALKSSYRKGLVLLIPNVIYSVYYVLVTSFMHQGTRRLPEIFNFNALLRQLVLQIGSFMDAIIGPSFFLKVWYSILENSSVSIMIILLFIVGYIMLSKSKQKENQHCKINKKVLTALIVLTLSSLGMFAITGYYPQMAFNLGNRTTIYASLLAAYLLVTLPMPKNVRRGVLLIFLVAIVGISAHWKQWNQRQMDVIDNICTNKELASYDGTASIYVSGNQYSKMGPFSHIEFLSEHWVGDSIFELAGHEKLSARSLNKRFVYENGAIIDKKYNHKFPVGDTVMVYDSEVDQLLEISAQELNSYINKLPDDKRHWIQFIENEHLNALILKLMPRLKYAF